METNWRQNQYELKKELNDAKDTLVEFERLSNKKTDQLEKQFYSKATMYQNRLAEVIY